MPFDFAIISVCECVLCCSSSFVCITTAKREKGVKEFRLVRFFLLFFVSLSFVSSTIQRSRFNETKRRNQRRRRMNGGGGER